MQKIWGFLIKITWIGFISGILLLFSYVWAVKNDLWGLFGGMPTLETLENPKSELASELYSSDYVLLGKYFRYNRTPVTYEEISPNLINALIATEDIRFEEHSGIDFKGTLAIIYYKLKGDKRGSSTITQQLAKNLFETRGNAYKGSLSEVKGIRTLIVKTKEWITAIKLENSYTKKEIITMYLNTVDFGSNAYGIQVAAKTFFDTTPSKLKVQEAAVLVGLLKAPTYYSPILNPENSLNRRNTVLEQMYKYKYIGNDELENYKNKPIELKYKVDNHNTGLATYFRSEILDFLLKWSKDNGYDLFSDGLKIYATIDSRVQKYAEDAMEKHMKFIQARFYEALHGGPAWVDENMKEIPGFIENVARRTERYKLLSIKYHGNKDSITYYMSKKIRMRIFSWKGDIDTLMSPFDSIRYYKKILQAGLMSVDPKNGHIKAWVGGINHKFFKYDHVRQSKRQPGSTFKPFVYLAAIDNGYSPCYQVQDIPVTFQYTLDGENKTWTPKNSEDEYTGESFTVRQAMARSINSITAYLIKQLGPQRVVDYARRLGITSTLEAVPALCLGSSDVSLYELVGAYATFANSGTYTEPQFITRIEDKNGNLIKEFIPTNHEAISEETAYIMLHMLKGGLEEKKGTSQGLFRYPGLFGGNEIGGKTGTTSNYSDGWYVGVTSNLVTGIWVGGDDRSIHFHTYTYGQGAKLALPIFGLFMEKVYADTTCGIKKGFFTRPSKPLSIQLDCSKYSQKGEGADSSELYINPKHSDLLNDL